MTSMMRGMMILAAGTAMTLASACTTTRLETAWTDPRAPRVNLDKVAVVAMTGTETTRRIAEDALAAKLQGVEAVPSYNILPSSALADEVALRQQMKARGFDGVVLLRVLSIQEEPRYRPAPLGGFYSYYDYTYPAMARYEYSGSTTVVRMETTVYSLRDGGQLVWSGVTQSAEPRSLKSTVNGIADVVSKAMRKHQLAT